MTRTYDNTTCINQRACGDRLSLLQQACTVLYFYRVSPTLQKFWIWRQWRVHRNPVSIVPYSRTRRRTPNFVCTTTCPRQGHRELASDPKTSFCHPGPGQTLWSIRYCCLGRTNDGLCLLYPNRQKNRIHFINGHFEIRYTYRRTSKCNRTTLSLWRIYVSRSCPRSCARKCVRTVCRNRKRAHRPSTWRPNNWRDRAYTSVPRNVFLILLIWNNIVRDSFKKKKNPPTAFRRKIFQSNTRVLRVQTTVQSFIVVTRTHALTV